MMKYIKTIEISMRSKFNEGIAYMMPEIFIQVFNLIILSIFWRTFLKAQGEGEAYIGKLLAYTYLSIILKDFLNIESPASSWNYEGIFNKLFIRPMNVLMDLAAETIGKMLPKLLFFTVPMLIIAPFMGIDLMPENGYFLLSFILSVSLGFAIDYIFACLTIRLMSLSWAVYSVRMALVGILSGGLIPFSLMPEKIGRILMYQPFASLSGGFLSIYTGLEPPFEIIITQLLWNIVLWPLAIFWFRHSREEIVSYGG
ncbi:MAG: hypothetical protein E7234_12210 [Lachnospiraceae bacterium]|nr:hypothetical protein [Lachnospiraceae bacterium]